VVIDPPAGLLATANAEVVPPGDLPWLAADYDTSHRVHRIEERLRERPTWDLAGLGAIQTDVVSRFAREMIAAWRGSSGDAERSMRSSPPGMARCRGRGAPALFAIATRQVSRAIFGDRLQRTGSTR
jgi:acyl-homoserine lactone acylase PvdQ